MLQEKEKAPLFTLPDQNGHPVSLSDFAGKKVVLYFYPRDNTPGCTRQACAFADAWEDYAALGVTVIGISKDSVSSHQKFSQKYQLPFILLSDPGTACNPGLRRLAGEKTLRQNQHGSSAHHLPH